MNNVNFYLQWYHGIWAVKKNNLPCQGNVWQTDCWKHQLWNNKTLHCWPFVWKIYLGSGFSAQRASNEAGRCYGMEMLSALLALCEGNPLGSSGWIHLSPVDSPQKGPNDAEHWSLLCCHPLKAVEQTVKLPASDRWIPLTQASKSELWCILCCQCQQVVEQTVKLTVIWDHIMLMWRHSIGKSSHEIFPFMTEIACCLCRPGAGAWGLWQYGIFLENSS